MSDDLPEGWVETTMAAVTERVASVKPEAEPRRDFGYVDISAIDKRTASVNPDDVRRFKGADAPSRARRPIRADDILFSNVRTNLRNVALIASSLPAQLCSTGFTVLRPTAVVLPEYLLRWVLTDEFTDVISETQTGTHYPATSDSQVLAQPVRLAPLAEQKRIVEKVETLLADVNHARDRLAKVPLILKRFRQSVVAAACSGKLTEEWRVQRGADPEAPWPVSSLAAVCRVVVDCPHSTPKWATAGEICLRTTNFFVTGLDVREVRYVSGQTYRQRVARLTPTAGDVVYSREGGILGIACVIPEGLRACLGQRMMLMRSDAARMRPQFLAHVLNSPSTLAVVRELTGGTASPHLNVGDIKEFSVPVPPLDEQDEVLVRLGRLLGLAEAIEKRLGTAARMAAGLPQTLLAKAFSGDLVPTEASLARADGRDFEPASAMLQRLAASASQASGESRGRGRTRRPDGSRGARS